MRAMPHKLCLGLLYLCLSLLSFLLSHLLPLSLTDAHTPPLPFLSAHALSSSPFISAPLSCLFLFCLFLPPPLSHSYTCIATATHAATSRDSSMGKAMSTAAVLAVATLTATALTPSTTALPTSGTDVARVSLAHEERKAPAGDETDRPSSQANGGTVRSSDAPLGETSAAAVGAAANEAAVTAAAASSLTSAPAGNAATCVPPLTLLHLRAAAAAAASASMAGPRDASSPVIPTSTSGLSWGGGGLGGLGESAIAANVGVSSGVIGGGGSLGERVTSPIGAGLVSVPGAPSLGFVDQHQENLSDMGVDKPVIDPEVRQKKVRRPSCLDRVVTCTPGVVGLV